MRQNERLGEYAAIGAGDEVPGMAIRCHDLFVTLELHRDLPGSGPDSPLPFNYPACLLHFRILSPY